MSERIEAEVQIDAPAHAVWEAWADPERVASWYVDRAEGRIGQSPKVEWTWGQMGMAVEYEVVEAEADRRFVLRTETPEGAVRETEVELEEEREGEGTRVRVVEKGLETDPEAVRSGWKMALGLLKVYVEVYYGRYVRSLLVMGKTEASPEEVVAVQRTAEGLERWTDSASGAMPEEGGSIRLELEGGVVVDGQVVRRTSTETSVMWPSIQGVLELKQFPVGRERAVAFRVFTWDDELDLEDLQNVLSDSLSRLVEALK